WDDGVYQGLLRPGYPHAVITELLEEIRVLATGLVEAHVELQVGRVDGGHQHERIAGIAVVDEAALRRSAISECRERKRRLRDDLQQGVDGADRRCRAGFFDRGNKSIEPSWVGEFVVVDKGDVGGARVASGAQRRVACDREALAGLMNEC